MSSGKWIIIALVAIVVACGSGYLTAYLPPAKPRARLRQRWTLPRPRRKKPKRLSKKRS